jgi:hypothetical protein
MKRSIMLAVLAAMALLVACSSPPKPAPIIGDDGFVTTIVSGETLTTQGLLPAYPACCPGAECCAPPYFCAYYDTVDASITDAGVSLTTSAGMRLVGSSPKAGVGAACKSQNATAFSAPVAIATLLSYDDSMDYGQPFSFANDDDSWIVDGARRGLGDFATDGTLSNGLIGLTARQPLWRGYGCVCLFGICASTCYDLRCDQASYDGASSGAYTLAAQGGSMMGVLPDTHWNDDFTEMSSGNPLTLGWRAAKKRALAYWNTNKISTPFIVITAADYANGCSDSNNTLAAEAYAAAFNPTGGNPVIPTMVIGFRMDATMGSSFDTVRRNGWGAMTTSWPGNARTDMKNAMIFMRRQAATGAFFVNPPANGEAIDDRTFKFYLNADGSETLIPNAGEQSGCGSSTQGYWLTRPEGATGRILINLCPGTVGVAAAAYTISGRVVYDCVETFPATATFSRDFDLTRCFSAGLVPRVTRLDWTTTQSSNTAVNFRLRLAAQKSLLSAATVATSGSALAWVPASISTYLDLSAATVPYNYGWARVEMDLLSSTDLITSPTVNNWKLTFTCTDGS